MRFSTPSIILLAASPCGLCHAGESSSLNDLDTILPNNNIDGSLYLDLKEHGNNRKLQDSCLDPSPVSASFTTTVIGGGSSSSACTPALVKDALATIMKLSENSDTCGSSTPDYELSILLDMGGDIDTDAIDEELEHWCAAAFEEGTLDFRKITKRGDAFDREFFHGGSDWNDQYELLRYKDGDDERGELHHVLKEDARRILLESEMDPGRPMSFPSYLPSFDNCEIGAVMCCHVADRQADDLGGFCNGDDGGDDAAGCADADPMDNTDVCVASMADSPVANRVPKGLAVYHLNEEGMPAEGNVNCHGFAWGVDEEANESLDWRYRGNLLFDVAFKQSLYEKGYVKNVPGAPMCGCIEQMPTVTRADCTKIESVTETYALHSDANLLELKLTSADVGYSPCGEEEDGLASHHILFNPNSVIDEKLVGKGNCADVIDNTMQEYGYKRSVLEIGEALFTPEDVSPARVLISFNVAVADIGSGDGPAFKVYDPDDLTEIPIKSIAMKQGNTAVELTLSSAPNADAMYRVSNLVTLHKRIAPMVTIEPDSDDGAGYDIFHTSWDHLTIGNWRLGFTCEACSDSHFSVSSSEDDEGKLYTSQIFRDDGTLHPGPRSDYNAWDDVDVVDGPSYSVDIIAFGDYGVQIRDWRIRQIDATHLSVTHASGNVARIYRSDGTVHGRVNSYSGYSKPLGEPACAYLAESYLQIGDWRFSVYDATHLSVAHRDGYTSAIYRTDGTVHIMPHNRPRIDFNGWTMPTEEALMGSDEGCAPHDPPEPNVLQIGKDWKLAQMYDVNHFSFSARQQEGQSGNEAQTAMIFRNTGTIHPGPRFDYNAWGEVPTYSGSPPRFGARTLEIDHWRIRQIDDTHLSITHEDGNVARIFRSDGTVHGNVNNFSGYATAALGDPTCAFLTEGFVQLGDWRLAEFDDEHLTVSHRDGKTSAIYSRSGTVSYGPTTDYNAWNFGIGDILQGSAEGCVSISGASMDSQSVTSTPEILVKFSSDLADDIKGIEDLFKVYDAANVESEIVIIGAALEKGDHSTLKLALSSEPSSEVSYQVSTVGAVPTKDPLETVPAGSIQDLMFVSWNYLQIGNWRLAHVCTLCFNSHFTISSSTNMNTAQIFRQDGTLHPGPRKDYNGFDVGAITGPTYSLSGESVQFGNLVVQVRDWRIRQIDATHLSVTHVSGNVSRIYRSDGTLHGKVNSYSGYQLALGEPTCAYLAASYLQIGDWRIGAFDAYHLSVSHRDGKTAAIYRGTDGSVLPGPQPNRDAWTIPEEDAIMGSKKGCETSSLSA